MRSSAEHELQWFLTAASVIGKAHVANSLPNQDCVESRLCADGRMVVAVVSDGAGTATHAHIGSRTTCAMMVAWLQDIGQRLLHDPYLSDAVVRDCMAEGIEQVRCELAREGQGLRHFHCTLVSCVITEHRSYVCQIGDSIAIATQFLTHAGKSSDAVDFFPEKYVRIVGTERGEYANETHFLTEEDWRAHLRITELPTAGIDALLLMTDGAMDVALTQGKVFKGFLSGAVGALLESEERLQRDALLQQWLADQRTHRVTADDKTMFIAIRQVQRRWAGYPVNDDSVDAQPDAPALPPPPLPPPPPPPPPLPLPLPPLPVLAADGHRPRLHRIRLSSIALSAAVGLLLVWLVLAVTCSNTDGSDAVAPRRKQAPPAAVPKPKTLETALPTAPPPTPSSAVAEILLLSYPLPELVMQPGTSARILVRMVSGGEVRITRVTAPSGSRLQVDADSPECIPASTLTAASVCMLTLRADAKAPLGEHRVTLSYVDLGTGHDHQASLRVHLERPPS